MSPPPSSRRGPGLLVTPQDPRQPPGRPHDHEQDQGTGQHVSPSNKGHRIRVAVSSSNSPRFEANPNTGKPFRADREMRVAKNTLHVSLKYPSRILLPLCAGGRKP